MTKLKKQTFKLYKDIVQLKELSSTEKIIYSYIQFTTSTEFTCKLSIRALALKLGMTNYSIQEGLKKLISMNLIKREGTSIVATQPQLVNQNSFYSMSYHILQTKLDYSSKFLITYVLGFINDNKLFKVSNNKITTDLDICYNTLQFALAQLLSNNIIICTQVGERYSNYSYTRLIELNREGFRDYLSKKVEVVQPKKKVAKKAHIQVEEVIKEKENVALKEKENIPLKEKESDMKKEIRLHQEEEARLKALPIVLSDLNKDLEYDLPNELKVLLEGLGDLKPYMTNGKINVELMEGKLLIMGTSIEMPTVRPYPKEFITLTNFKILHEPNEEEEIKPIKMNSAQPKKIAEVAEVDIKGKHSADMNDEELFKLLNI